MPSNVLEWVLVKVLTKEYCAIRFGGGFLLCFYCRFLGWFTQINPLDLLGIYPTTTTLQPYNSLFPGQPG